MPEANSKSHNARHVFSNWNTFPAPSPLPVCVVSYEFLTTILHLVRKVHFGGGGLRPHPSVLRGPLQARFRGTVWSAGDQTCVDCTQGKKELYPLYSFSLVPKTFSSVTSFLSILYHGRVLEFVRCFSWVLWKDNVDPAFYSINRPRFVSWLHLAGINLTHGM